MIFAEKAILLLGSLKVRALCAIYLASQTNAERRLQKRRGWIRLGLKPHNLMKGRAGGRWDQPVEPVLQSQLDGAQVSGVGDYCAVCGILDQIHRTGERSSNLCNTHTL